MDRNFLASHDCEFYLTPMGVYAGHPRFREDGRRRSFYSDGCRCPGDAPGIGNANIEFMIHRYRIPVFSDIDCMNEFGPAVISRGWMLLMPLDMEDDHPAMIDFVMVVTDACPCLEKGDPD